MNIGIVGLGLIGGSLAKAVKKNTKHTVLGFDISKQVFLKAKLLEAVDYELTADRLPICDIVIIATTPEVAVDYIKNNAEIFKKGAIVLDICGIKRKICTEGFEIAKNNGFVFIGGHPMAGLEHSGFNYSSDKLFENASMIITPEKGTDIAILDCLNKLFGAMGFTHIEITTPENHDRIIAYTSQLAHIVSSAFVKSPTSQEHYGYSAGSYKDMTRVALLDENMWTELFKINSDNLLPEVETLIKNLEEYRDALKADDFDKVRQLLKEGKEQKIRADRKDLNE